MGLTIKYTRVVFTAFFILLLVNSCSTKKNRWVNRQYHNLTAHYNGYFWAREAIKEGIDKLDRSHIDDHDKILPFYRYADDKAAKANIPSWDKAITKTSLVIAKHSMLIKGTEYCRWIDENYLVLGQGHFYKRDYYAAVEVFEFMVRQYKNNPTRYLALLWLIKTYNAQNSVINTQSIIDLLESDKGFPKKFQGMFDVLRAEYYVKMENYPKAIEYLTRAIPAEKKKKQRARFTYILGQLYEQTGNPKKASHYYEQCTKMSPPYELLFNARIKRAMTASGADSKEVKKLLTKMLKDEKNREYRDQIYYALAELNMKDGDTTLGMEQLKLSAAASLVNTKQRGLSYLKLADIYFSHQDYVPAQVYYDSCASFLPKDHRQYALVLNKKTSLTALIKNIRIISTEDSLLRLSAMDTAKLTKMIDKIIADLTEEEKRKEEEKINNQNTVSNTPWNPNNQNQTGNTTTGAWYFYNPAQLSFGVSDFLKKWGNREREDDWRRSIKETDPSLVEDPDLNNKQDTAKKDVKLADNKTRNFYLKNIPFSEEQKLKSNERIIEAYYALGGIYKEQLQDLPKANTTFEELNKRYPGNKYELSSWYSLYRIALTVKNIGAQQKYKSQICTKYAESEICKLVSNPNYANENAGKKSEVEKFYNDTYDHYVNGRHTEVIRNAYLADSLYPKSEFMPKFALLNAYSVGRTGSVQDYKNALQRVVAKYPKDPVRQKAQNLLDAIERVGITNVAPKDTTKPAAPDFIYQETTEHFCAIFIMNKKVKAADLAAKLSNFNTEYFSLASLGVSPNLLDLETQIILVKSFQSGSKAMDYYSMLVGDLKVFKDLQPKDYKVTVISADNWARLFKNRKKLEYISFFEENYKKKN